MGDGGPATGWYEDPEHDGWLRFWDGQRWTDHRSPVVDAPTQPVYEQSRAGVALALAVVGFFGCGPLSLVGLVQGVRELRRIDQGLVDPGQRGVALAAAIVGGLVTLLMVVFFAIVVIFVLFGGDPAPS